MYDEKMVECVWYKEQREKPKPLHWLLNIITKKRYVQVPILCLRDAGSGCGEFNI